MRMTRLMRMPLFRGAIKSAQPALGSAMREMTLGCGVEGGKPKWPFSQVGVGCLVLECEVWLVQVCARVEVGSKRRRPSGR